MTLIFIHLLTIEIIGQQNDDAPSKKCHQLPNKTTENNDSRPFSHKQPLSHSLNVKPSLSLSPTHTHTRSSTLVPSFFLFLSRSSNTFCLFASMNETFK